MSKPAAVQPEIEWNTYSTEKLKKFDINASMSNGYLNGSRTINSGYLNCEIESSFYQYRKGNRRFHSKIGRTITSDAADNTVHIKNKLKRFENLIAFIANLQKNGMHFKTSKRVVLHLLSFFVVTRLKRCRGKAFYETVNTSHIQCEHENFQRNCTKFGRYKEILRQILWSKFIYKLIVS